MTLRLADAIRLGDVLKNRDAEIFLWRDGSCGCALGGAFLANGGIATKAYYPKSVIEMWPWQLAQLWLWLTRRKREGK